MNEFEFRKEMAKLNFYGLCLMGGCVLANYKSNINTDGEFDNNVGVMLYIKEKEFEINPEWIKKENSFINLKKLNKAFELIDVFYNQEK